RSGHRLSGHLARAGPGGLARRGAVRGRLRGRGLRERAARLRRGRRLVRRVRAANGDPEREVVARGRGGYRSLSIADLLDPGGRARRRDPVDGRARGVSRPERGGSPGACARLTPTLPQGLRYGLMFWFRWKTLSGSYRRLTSRSLFQFGPKAADTASVSVT